jgi:hypothetical protein
MRRETLLTLAGAATVLGGLIDLLGPLAYPHMAQQPKLMIYVLIDVLLLFGLIGLQSAAGRAAGWLGLVGFVLAVSGVLLVRSSAANVLGPSTYPIGSGVWAIGMAIMGLAQLRPRTRFRVAGYLWMLAVGLPLVAMIFRDHRPSTLATAHILFALGFIAVGVQLIRQPRAVIGNVP